MTISPRETDRQPPIDAFTANVNAVADLKRQLADARDHHSDMVGLVKTLQKQIAESEVLYSNQIANLQWQLAEAKEELVKANGWRDTWHGASHTQHEIIKALNADLGAARERERVLKDALEWYSERADSLANRDWKKNPRYAEAIFVELSLDGGKRARVALQQLDSTEGEGKDE